MSETGESHVPRPYEALSSAEKVIAILGIVRRPLPKEAILNFAGFDPSTLSDPDREEVEVVFTGLSPNNDGKYMAPELKAAHPDIDFASADSFLIERMWKAGYGS